MVSRAQRILGIPHAALLSVSFALISFSFPIGAYVFFEPPADADIGPGYPLDLAYPALGWMADSQLRPSSGDAFVAAWSLYAVLFAVCIMGPRTGFSSALASLISEGRETPSAMMAVLRWLGIMVLVSAAIAWAQGLFGVTIEPPAFASDQERFLGAALAPLLEEPAFRLLLIGAPLAVFAWHPGSASPLRALWRPHDAGPHGRMQVAALIAFSAALFGALHVAGDGWSYGKAPQAAAAGLILGWVYYRHGIGAAVVLHWAANYFVLSYAYMTARLTGTDVAGAFDQGLLLAVEAVLLASGAMSALFVAARYKRSLAARQNPGL